MPRAGKQGDANLPETCAAAEEPATEHAEQDDAGSNDTPGEQPTMPPALARLLIFDNPEKKGHRRGGPSEAAPDWPFRLLLSGPPGSGKRNMLLNLIFQLLQPPPSAVHIVHYDPDTVEYTELETLGVPIYYYSASDFPTAENLSAPEEPIIGEHSGSSCSGDEPGDEPGDELDDECVNEYGASPLVIIDECTDATLPPESRHRLERLLNYCSTHRNTAVICSIQSALSLPPRARRAFDHYALWPQPDKSASNMAATRAGIPPGMLQELFGLCESRHDCIWIDTTRNQDDPYRYRLNMLWPIRCTSAVSFDDY